MKYFLVLGIEFKKYKRPANITVHVGDKFIDEFELDRDFPYATDVVAKLETKWYKKYFRSRWLSSPDWVEKWNTLPSLFKVYELDDIDLEGRLKIKVENSNSDYTNGFMNKSSTIKFPVVSIIQKDLTKNHGEKLMEKILKLDVATDGTWPDGKYFGIKPSDRVPYLRKQRWPCAEYFYVKKENDIYEKGAMKSRHWWIGGSFTAEFTIKKIQDTIYVGLPAESEWIENPRTIHPIDLIIASSNQLLNIYDEDQRSNNTKN